MDETLLRCGFVFQTPLANGRTENDNNVGCLESPASPEHLAPKLRVGTGSTVLGNNRGGGGGGGECSLILIHAG